MKIQNDETKQKMVQRMRRIEGQARGVANMLEDERDCREILQQLVAIRSAVQAASRAFLQEYANACLLDMEDQEHSQPGTDLHHRREQMVQDLITFLDKAP